jgi:hypothetical protein
MAEVAPSSVTQPSSPAIVPPPVAVMVEKEAASTAAKVPAAPESFKAAPKPAGEAPVTASFKAEEPKKAAPFKAEEPKKAAPVKAEEPKSAGARPQAPQAPSSRRPASLRAVPALEEEFDPSSISAEFFRKDQDSVPPVEEHEEVDPIPAPVLSPSALARRARLRRLVAGVVAFAGVISIAVVSKQVSAKRQAPMPAMAIDNTKRDTTSAPAPPPAKDEAKPTAPEPAKVAEEKKADDKKADDQKADDKKADDKKADEVAKKDDAKPEEAKPQEAKKDDAKPEEAKPALSSAEVAALKKEAESLLNRNKNKEAIEKAREAIAADPSDALPYLFLGTALQATGKWKDGIEAYCECVRNATKGPVNECRAVGGHK